LEEEFSNSLIIHRVKTKEIMTATVFSLQAGSPLNHVRERRRARRTGGKESGEEVPLSRLAALPLDFAQAATPRRLMLQREPARRLDGVWISDLN